MGISIRGRQLMEERQKLLQGEFEKLLREGETKSSAVSRLSVKYGVSTTTIYRDLQLAKEVR